jgi:DedD protein
MQEGAKKRLVGAIAIVALAVIFVPMFFENEPSVSEEKPDEPMVGDRFEAESFVTPLDPGAGRLEEETWLEPGGFALPAAEDVDLGEEVTFDEPSADLDEPVGAASVSAPSIPEAPAPMGANDGMTGWITQVASLGTSAGAQELADELRKQGYSAFVEPAQVGGRTYYRVRVGPEVDRARADETAARLSRTYKDPFVQRYP